MKSFMLTQKYRQILAHNTVDYHDVKKCTRGIYIKSDISPLSRITGEPTFIEEDVAPRAGAWIALSRITGEPTFIKQIYKGSELVAIEHTGHETPINQGKTYQFIYSINKTGSLKLQPEDEVVFHTIDSQEELTKVLKKSNCRVRIVENFHLIKQRAIEPEVKFEGIRSVSFSYDPHLPCRAEAAKYHNYLSDHLPKGMMIPVPGCEDQLSLITWNILAPYYVHNGFDVPVVEVAQHTLERAKRISQSILSFIDEREADVIGLQEDFIFSAKMTAEAEYEELQTELIKVKENLVNELQKLGYGVLFNETRQPIIYDTKSLTLVESKEETKIDSTRQKFKFKDQSTIQLTNVFFPYGNDHEVAEEWVLTTLAEDHEAEDVSISIIFGDFNHCYVPFNAKKDRSIIGNVVSSSFNDHGIQGCNFTDGAFYANKDGICQQPMKFSNLDPHTGECLAYREFPANAFLMSEGERYKNEVERQSPIMDCAWSQLLFTSYQREMLADANITMTRTSNALSVQQVHLDLSESKDEKFVKTLKIQANKIRGSKNPNEVDHLIFPDHGIERLTNVLTQYRNIQAFEFIYKLITKQVKEKSKAQFLKRTFMVSFYSTYKPKNEGSLDKALSLISTHAAKDPKSPGAQAHVLAQRYIDNYQNNAELTAEIRAYVEARTDSKAKEKPQASSGILRPEGKVNSK